MEPRKNTASSCARSKKRPPPPLCLPVTNPTIGEEKIHPNERNERKQSNQSCPSSSSDDCSHKPVPFILPTSQRQQIIRTLQKCSSTLLVPPPTGLKSKRPFSGTSRNLAATNNLSNNLPDDSAWLELMNSILKTSLRTDLTILLDKYKTTYFDRMNAPHTSDETVRSNLYQLASTLLASYSSPSTTAASEQNEESPDDYSDTMSTNSYSNNNPAKRKCKAYDKDNSPELSMSLNTQTKFLISYKDSDQPETQSTTKTNRFNQHNMKRSSRLFKYIPNEFDQNFLVMKGYLKANYISSAQTTNNNCLCLMLYDEVIREFDQEEIRSHGISINQYFTLPERILVNIRSCNR